MKIYGLDFTSAPTRKKPITCAICELHEPAEPAASHNANVLTMQANLTMPTFAAFEDFLQSDGSWLAGLDFPFGQPRQLIANLGWPAAWADYMQLIAAMSKAEFEQTLTDYRASRLPGDKQHLRVTDRYANARSPMMLHRVPVGKMFFQGAPRLLASGVSILPCRPTPSANLVVEGYPALVARKWLGKRSYKSDERGKQTSEQTSARRDLLAGLCSPALLTHYGLHLTISAMLMDMLIKEPMGDLLDALLCAIQAAWVYTQRENNYGIPSNCDKNEGWIADPVMF
ncbi:MAG TPA: DUF429 domain-containing protein [Ktedonobacteraceae bacterium]|nr:DUF429 domain-containing protein [Ktedonobacteraceae bacterium]